MTESTPLSSPNYDVGPCPICGQGLRGVRICCGQPIVVCDECDAVWSSPSLSDRVATTSDPRCESCGQSLWGDQARWATREEIEAAGWWSQVRQSTAGEGTPFTASDEGTAGGTARSSDSPETPGHSGALYRGAVFVLLLMGAAVAALAVL